MDDHLPEGWATAKVADFTTKVGSGATPRGGSESYKKAGTPLIRSQNVHFDGFRDEGLAYLDDVQANALKEVTVEAGDVLLNITGASIGRVTQAPELMQHARVNQHVCIIRPVSLIDSGYLARYLSSHAVQNMVMSEEYGVTRQALTKGQILGFDIPIPPAAEQARIVAKVAALLAHVNAARQRLAKVPAILKRFRQSVVAAACSGRLTADLREQKVDLRPLAQFDQQTTLIDENGPPEIPGEWRWETLCSVAEYQGGYAFKSPRFIEVGKNQVLRIGNVRPGFIDPNVAPVFITEQDANQVHRFELQENDILISMTGTRYKRDYGFVGLVPQAPQRFFLNQRVSRLRCNPICLSRLLFLWLQTETFRNCFFKDETGNVNQGNVGATPLKAGPVALPPIPEQHEIVRRVEVLFRLADAIEKRVATATARAEKLTQAILAKAFRGELVPTEAELARREGRDYEPASALLERIRAERAANNGKPTAKRKTRKERR